MISKTLEIHVFVTVALFFIHGKLTDNIDACPQLSVTIDEWFYPINGSSIDKRGYIAFYNDDGLTWNEANEYCVHNYGAELASIHSIEEQYSFNDALKVEIFYKFHWFLIWFCFCLHEYRINHVNPDGLDYIILKMRKHLIGLIVVLLILMDLNITYMIEMIQILLRIMILLLLDMWKLFGEIILKIAS